MPRKLRKNKERIKQKRSINTPGTQRVKREFEFEFNSKFSSKVSQKKTDKSHYLTNSSTIVKDLTRTIVIASILFSLELMIYSLVFEG